MPEAGVQTEGPRLGAGIVGPNLQGLRRFRIGEGIAQIVAPQKAGAKVARDKQAWDQPSLPGRRIEIFDGKGAGSGRPRPQGIEARPHLRLGAPGAEVQAVFHGRFGIADHRGRHRLRGAGRAIGIVRRHGIKCAVSPEAIPADVAAQQEAGQGVDFAARAQAGDDAPCLAVIGIGVPWAATGFVETGKMVVAQVAVDPPGPVAKPLRVAAQPQRWGAAAGGRGVQQGLTRTDAHKSRADLGPFAASLNATVRVAARQALQVGGEIGFGALVRHQGHVGAEAKQVGGLLVKADFEGPAPRGRAAFVGQKGRVVGFFKPIVAKAIAAALGDGPGDAFGAPAAFRGVVAPDGDVGLIAQGHENARLDDKAITFGNRQAWN